MKTLLSLIALALATLPASAEETRTLQEVTVTAIQDALGVDQALPAWQMSAGFHLTRHGETRNEIPGESEAKQ